MRKYVVPPAAEILPGTHKVFTVGGRPIGIFNLDGGTTACSTGVRTRAVACAMA